MTGMGPRHCSHLHNYPFKVGIVQVERSEIHRGPLFLECRNRVNYRVPKIGKLRFINEVKFEHSRFGRGWGWR